MFPPFFFSAHICPPAPGKPIQNLLKLGRDPLPLGAQRLEGEVP